MAVQQENSGKQIGVIQSLRGVAVMLVMLVHAINVVDFRYRDWVESSSGWLAHFLAVNEFGACGVDLFFVISGFVMAMIVDADRHRSVTEFLRDRVLRVAPLYWIASAVYILPAFAVVPAVPIGWVMTAVLIVPGAHYITPPLVVGWSLAFELVFYGVVAIAIGLLRREHRVPALVLVMLALAIVGHIMRPLDGMAAILFNPIMAEFAIGLVVYSLWRRWRDSDGAAMSQLLVCIGLALLLASAVLGFDFKTLHMYVIRGETGAMRALIWGVPWGIVVLGLLLRQSRRREHRADGGGLLRRIGDASYSIYLVHQLPLDIAEYQVAGHVIPPDVLISSAYVVALFLGMLVHRTIEQPLMAYFKRTFATDTTSKGNIASAPA